MEHKKSFWLSVVVLFFAFSCVAETSSVETIQGRWRVLERDGRAVRKNAIFIFHESDFQILVNGRKDAEKAKFHIDSTATPCRVDVVVEEGGETRTYKNIVKFDDDQLILKRCNTTDADYPENFDKEPDTDVIVLERIKEQRPVKRNVLATTLLEGTWDCTELWASEARLSGDAVGLSLRFVGNTITYLQNGVPGAEGTFSINTNVLPNHLDIVSDDNGGGLAIFELNNDTLRICGIGTEGVRPESFELSDSSTILLFKKASSGKTPTSQGEVWQEEFSDEDSIIGRWFDTAAGYRSRVFVEFNADHTMSVVAIRDDAYVSKLVGTYTVDYSTSPISIDILYEGHKKPVFAIGEFSNESCSRLFVFEQSRKKRPDSFDGDSMRLRRSSEYELLSDLATAKENREQFPRKSVVRGEALPEYSEVSTFPSGEIKDVRLSKNATIQGVSCWKGSQISFYKNGQLEEASLAGNQTINGLKCGSGEGRGVVFFESGQIQMVALAEPQIIKDVNCSVGVAFYESGQIEKTVLSENQRFGGVEYLANTTITFDKTGRVEKGTLAPMTKVLVYPKQSGVLKSPRAVPFDPDVNCYFSFDDDGGAVLDQSGNGVVLESYGAVFSPEGKYSGAYEFNGRDSFMQAIPDITLTPPYTVTAWVYLRSRLADGRTYASYCGRTILARGNLNRSGKWDYIFNVNAYGKLGFVTHSTFSRADCIQNPEIFPLNQWVFVAFTHEGMTGRLYQDSELVRTRANMNAGNKHNWRGTFVGKIYNTHPRSKGDHFWDGKIDELRVFKKVLSEQELKTLQKELPIEGVAQEKALLCPERQNTSPVFYLSFDDGTCNDVSGQKHHGTGFDVQSSSDAVKGKAMTFDGLHAHISVERNSKMTLGQHDKRSILLWWKADLIDEQTQSLLSMRGRGDGQRGLSVDLFKGKYYRLHLRFYHHADFPVSLQPNQWNHLAVIKNGTDWSIYHNGKKLGNSVKKGWPFRDHANAEMPLWIGRDHAGDNPFLGNIDEVIFFDRALSESEIKKFYLKEK